MSRNLKAVILYTVIALILTWPLAINIGSSYPSAFVTEGGDPNMYIWLMDAVAKKVTNFSFHPGEMLFYPSGINFLGGYEGPIMLLVSTPVVLLTHNAVLAYNLVLLLAIILTCFVCYKLILYLTESYPVALLVGFSFGFSPYMMVRSTQHIDLLFLFSALLVVLYGLKSVENPNRKNLLWLIFSVFLTAISAWYYLVGSLIFLLILGIFKFSRIRENKKQWLWTIGGIGFLLVLFSIPMFLNSTSMSDEYVKFLVDYRGADPREFFVPHPFMHSWSWPLYKNFPSPFESTSYFGIIGLIALIVVCLPRFKIPNKRLWLSLIIVSILLSLGNYIQIGNHQYPAPFSFLREFPPFDHIRSPNRFFIFAYLGATIVFAYFLSQIKDQIKNKKLLLAGLSFLIIVMVSERAIVPFPLVSIKVPEFYKEIGNSNEKFAIADIPMLDPGRSLYNYYQIYHKKPIVNGEYTWTTYDQHTFDFTKSNGFLTHTFSNPCSRVVPIKPGDAQNAFQHLADNNIRYLVVHNLLFQYEECYSLIKYVHDFLKDKKPVFSDGEITVYSTK